MRFSNIYAIGLLALLIPAIAQQTTPLPRLALESATAVADQIRKEFDNTGVLNDAATISNKVVNSLKKLNDFFTNTVYPSVNPQRFKPHGQLRERTCDERKAIFQAYKNLFNALIEAKTSMGKAICRVEIELPTGLVLDSNARLDPLSKAAKDQLDLTANNVRRLWDRTTNKYNSFDFYVFGCKARFNAKACDEPGDGCTNRPRINCPVNKQCCYLSFDENGKNPNKDQCFANEEEVMKVGSVSGISSSASSGWENLKDCRQCAAPDATVLPTCVSLSSLLG